MRAGVSAELAADGIAEAFGLLAALGSRRIDLAGSGETIHVHATDTGYCEWLVTRAPSGVEITATCFIFICVP